MSKAQDKKEISSRVQDFKKKYEYGLRKHEEGAFLMKRRIMAEFASMPPSALLMVRDVRALINEIE